MDSVSFVPSPAASTLAEPVAECARCEMLRGLADTAAAEQGLAQRRMMEAQKQRDEARAEVERLKVVLDTVRAARSLLDQLRDHVSDHACDELLSLLSDEPLDVDGNLYLTPSQAAYQRGAEAMREATAQLIQSTWTAETPEQVRALPVPEDKP